MGNSYSNLISNNFPVAYRIQTEGKLLRATHSKISSTFTRMSHGRLCPRRQCGTFDLDDFGPVIDAMYIGRLEEFHLRCNASW